MIKANKDEVIKTEDRENIDLEVEKTQKAHELCRKSNLFYVPKVLFSSVRDGIIKLERINGMASLNRLYYRRKYDKLFYAIGRSLAFIHNNISYSKKKQIPDNFLITQNDMAFLHCDFGMGNIKYIPEKMRIVILDWGLNPVIGKRFNYGPIYFDIAWFITNYFYSPSYYLFAIKDKNRILNFLKGYSSLSNKKLDMRILGRYIQKINNIYFNYLKRRRWTYIFHFFSYLSVKRFAKNEFKDIKL